MIQYLLIALLLGTAGSFHCAGMCGPLALSLPLNSQSTFTRLFGSFVYNAGRVVTYGSLGLVFGVAGRSFAFFGFQQWLSVVAGSLILLFLFVPLITGKKISNGVIYPPFTKYIRKKVGLLFNNQSSQALFLIGILNGLLPCGMVYVAAATALSSGDALTGALFMIFFGFGTLPLMWSLTFFGNYINLNLRKKIRTAYPYFIAVMACMLIIRGLGLGIPYISPQTGGTDKMTIECSNQP